MKRTTRSFVSAGAALVAAAGVGLYLWNTEPEKTETGETITKLPLSSVGELTRVEVSGSQIYTIEHHGRDGWFMVQPHKMKANPDTARGLWSALSSQRLDQVFTEDDRPDDTEMGLRTSEHTIRLVGTKGTALITLGDLNAFNRLLHIRIEDDRGTMTGLTSSNIERAAAKSVTAYLNIDMLAANPRRLELLKVTPRAGLIMGDVKPIAYTIKRTDVIVEIAGVQAERFFVVTEPEVDGPDVDTMQHILGGFTGKVSNFVEDNEANRAKLGLSDPAFLLEFRLRSTKLSDTLDLDEPVTMIVSSPSEADPQLVYLTRSDMPFIVQAHRHVFDSLAATQEQLETKKVIILDISAVHTIELNLRGTQATLEHTKAGGGEAAGWKFLTPTQKQAKANPINSLLVAVSVLEGTERVAEGLSDAQLANFGLDPANRRAARFVARNGAELAELWVGKAEGDGYYVKRRDSRYVVKVGKERLVYFPHTLSDFSRSPR